ncbi:SRPBCC family protein [Blastopirellula sp. JC732]|uniref:SRPBCC family protein n=1 Tax=Blastopirellula sediminis TaxID=2894196 RepID=A0A9X1MPM9_9BACT|nr:SRPBCC family protein [Blastopirellula sediminis]MCC9631043.1 SRPBCC family protein [Blastopirellula sediminis]
MNDANEVPVDCRIETSRLIPYSPAQIFAAFRDPAILARWWGPNGFTNTFHEFDFQPGGHWRFIMHGPNGADYLNESRFLEIVAPTRIVFDHQSAPHFQSTLTFAPAEKGCHLHWRMAFDDAQTCANVRSFAGDGLEQNLDRLTATLDETAR